MMSWPRLWPRPPLHEDNLGWWELGMWDPLHGSCVGGGIKVWPRGEPKRMYGDKRGPFLLKDSLNR